MAARPPDAVPYHRTPEFTEATLPPSLVLREHATKPGVWERIRVIKGRLRCRRRAEAEGAQELRPGQELLVGPGEPHALELTGEPVRVRLEFLRSPEDVRGHWSARRHGSARAGAGLSDRGAGA